METRPVDRRELPADVVSAGPQAQALYTAALEFEGLLLRELTAQLSSGAEGDEEGAGGGASAVYRDLLPEALADGVAGAGGAGLARVLYDSFERRGV